MRALLRTLQSLVSSRKFISAVVAVLVAVLVGLVPALEPVAPELFLVILTVASAQILGIAHEDAAAFSRTELAEFEAITGESIGDEDLTPLIRQMIDTGIEEAFKKHTGLGANITGNLIDTKPLDDP